MRRGMRAPRGEVGHDIQMLVRSFPGEQIRIVRRQQNGYSDVGELRYIEVEVYNGEGIFIPAGGLVAQYGLGQVEEDTPQLLLGGWVDIRQGDLYTRTELLPGGSAAPPRVYQVLYAPNPWHAFTHVMLQNFGQGT